MSTQSQYERAVNGLLPSGLIFPCVEEDSTLGKLLSTIAASVLASENATDATKEEMYPDIVGSFSDEWAAIAGFPRFGFEDLTAQQQRDAVLAWLNVNAFSNKQFFVDIAAIMGYEVIVEDRNDDTTIGDFEFIVTTSSDLPLVYFMTGQSTTGEPLVSTGSQEPLEALIEFFAPAHTTPAFFYASNLISETGDNLISETGDNLIG